ncbi:ATP-dependent helicase [Mesoplasma photuris]|uniref:ATP-dependent helicase n=1 Tax=Mesoplasma photuris TaxID=217731 RepID=UPI0004E1A118|nr:UvrD-helicase domain-containing protein [Mesoplasma photuris]
MNNNLLHGLNSKQLEAVVTTNQPLRIIAGAGSGKTKVITTKIAYLIKNENIAPWRILAVTFTNKAAKEMQERVTHIIGEESSKPLISTFHSWCARILREEAEYIGLSKNFIIIDQGDQKTILKKIIKEFNLAIDSNMKAIEKDSINRIANWKENFIDPVEAMSEAYDSKHRLLAKIYENYENYLNENNLVDFNDLQLKVHRIFNENPEIKEKWRNKYDYVMVDEFQDTNEVQFDLIKFLTKGKQNLTVVGDPDQTIYSWRGAKVNIILNFENDFPDSKTVILNENYRSTQKILDIANDFIAHNKNREHKNIFTNNPGGEIVKVKECQTVFTEAKFVGNEIKDLFSKGYSPKDIFVLYRTNSWSRNFELVFDNMKIPYQMIGSIKFRERAVIKDSLAFLKVVAVKDSMSFERVLKTCKGVGQTTIQKIILEAESQNIDLYNFITQEDDSQIRKITKHLDKFRDTIIRAVEMFENNINVQEIMKFILVNSGYEETLKAKNDEENLNNIYALYDQMNLFDLNFDPEFYNQENKTIAFIQEESLSNEEVVEVADKVTLLTIHSAKGLENKVVFLVGLNRDVFPNRLSTYSNLEIEEERRALYVALTRAKERLYISYVSGEFLYQSQGPAAPSNFIKELNKDLYEIERGLFAFADGTVGGGVKSSFVPKEAEKQTSEIFPKGDIVTHSIFGDGIIINVIGKQYQVAFNDARYSVMFIAFNNTALKLKK